MENFTFNDYLAFSSDEERWREEGSGTTKLGEVAKPKLSSIQNILAFSKALSHRKSRMMDQIECVLN